MNPTRWVYLYDGIQRHERQYADLMQAAFSRVLGAHLIPITDPETGKLRMPETLAEVQPVLPAIARPAFLVTLGEMFGKIGKQEEQVAHPREVDEAPPLDMSTDTDMEVMGPDRQHVAQIDRRVDEPLEQDVSTNRPIGPAGSHPVPTARRSSFVLDE